MSEPVTDAARSDIDMGWRHRLPGFLRDVPIWVLLAIVVGVVAVAVMAITSKGEDEAPERKLTLCEAIRESKSALRPSDYRRLSGYTQAQMEAVVASNCPELGFYVLDD